MSRGRFCVVRIMKPGERDTGYMSYDTLFCITGVFNKSMDLNHACVSLCDLFSFSEKSSRSSIKISLHDI